MSHALVGEERGAACPLWPLKKKEGIDPGQGLGPVKPARKKRSEKAFNQRTGAKKTAAP